MTQSQSKSRMGPVPVCDASDPHCIAMFHPAATAWWGLPTGDNTGMEELSTEL